MGTGFYSTTVTIDKIPPVTACTGQVSWDLETEIASVSVTINDWHGEKMKQ